MPGTRLTESPPSGVLLASVTGKKLVICELAFNASSAQKVTLVTSLAMHVQWWGGQPCTTYPEELGPGLCRERRRFGGV